MNEKLLTFKTNHTLLGQVQELENTISIKEPVQVVIQPTQQGPMMGFSPFLEYAEEFNTGITIAKEDILCITTPSRELVNQYNKMFGSGITIASSIPKV